MIDFLIKKFIKNSQCTQDLKVRTEYGRLAGFVGILCNLIISLGKIIIGFVIGSVSIMADGVNNLSDASAGVISLIGFKMASKPADKEHPYGHGRYEYLSALMVSIFVMVIGVELFGSSFQKILKPAPVDFGIITALILIVSILIKCWMLCFYRKIGKLIDSNALLATAADCRNDVIATSAILIGSIISHYTSFEADGYMGVAVAIFILYSGYGLVSDTLNPMLGRAPDAELVQMIRDKIMGYQEVMGIHDLLIHDYGPGRQFGSVHVEMAAEGNPILQHDIIDNIERDCLENMGLHIVIHYDPIVTSDEATNELRKWLSGIVKEKLDPTLSIHDLRTVPGTTHTNVIFDIEAPFDYKQSDIDLKESLRQLVSEKYPNHFLVITVDRV